MGRTVVSSLLFVALYFGAACASLDLTRFDGGVAFVWTATALLTARLMNIHSIRAWPATIVLAYLTNLAASSLFGAGWPVTPFISLVNVGEGVLAAWLLRYWRSDDFSSLASLGHLGLYLLAVGILAPVASAVLGPAMVSFVLGRPLGANLIHWIAGHALANITFTPLFGLLFSGELLDWFRHHGWRRLRELLVALAAVTATCVIAFDQTRAPILFLPLIAIIIVTFRLGRVGAALSITVLAVLAVLFTLHGGTPLDLSPVSLGIKIQFIQFYLASVVLCVLPVAAELEHRGRLFQALRESEASYRLVTENSTDIIMRTDVEGRIVFVSPAIRRLGGYDPASLVGLSAVALVHPDHVAHVTFEHRLALERHAGRTRFEYLALTATGEARWFETTMQSLFDDEGNPVGAVSVIRDVHERKQREGQLVEAALTDSLTGIANRRAFMAELETMARERHQGCVALFDIDHFKTVNDRFGHDVGDRVLREFATVLQKEVRSGDCVARIGGEEFAILMPGLDGTQASAVCQRVLDGLARHMSLCGGERIFVTASAGIAEVGAEPQQAIKRADAALYVAKACGRDQLKLAA